MTYYEVATVKKYKRKNNKDSTQINLGVNSKFAKDTKVIVISEVDFNRLTSNDDVDLKKELDDMKAKLEETNSQNEKIDDLKNQLLKEKEEKEKLLITITTNERNIKDNELLISSKENDIKDKDRIIETLTHNWVWYKRIFNILPGNINLNDTEDEKDL